MVHPPRPWLHLKLIVLTCTLLVPAVLRAQSPPPAPVLLALSDDRPAPGDRILLTGTNLGSGSDTVVVHFDPSLTVPVPTPNSQQISLIVPQGAKTGNVSITVTHTMPDGTIVTQGSNTLPIMVIWKTRDITPLLAPYGENITTSYNLLLHGTADDILTFTYRYTCGLYCDVRDQEVWRIGHDGSATSLLSWLFSPYSQGFLVDNADVARNPVTGDLVGVAEGYYGGNYTLAVLNFSTGQMLWSCTFNWLCAQDWYPKQQVDFDYQGNLIVAGMKNDYSGSSGGSLGMWRFGPTDPVVLDPFSTASLLPGGMVRPPLSDGWSRNPRSIAAAGDGSVWAIEDTLIYGGNDCPVSATSTAWHIATNGGQVDYHQLPQPAYSCPVSAWYLAADCRGEGYAVNPWLSDLEETSVTVYRLSDMAALATFPSPGDVLGLNTDRFGNLYFSAYVWGTPFSRYIRRILPQELPAGFYCPLSQPAGAQAKARATGTPAACSFCFPQKKLVVEIDGAIHEDGDRVQIPLGRKLDLKAWWHRQLQPLQPAQATWQLDGAQPNWESEHADAAAANLVESQAASEAGVLFRDDVLLLFDEGNQFATVPTRTIWPVHNGDVDLKLRAMQTDGQTSAITVHLTVTYDGVKLGQSWTYDANVLHWANAFGVPPQHVKGLIQQESRFNKQQYRYEPLGWDYGGSLTSGVLFSLRSDPYLQDYRFAEPAGVPRLRSPAVDQGPSLTQDDIDGRLHATSSYWLTAGKDVCMQVATGMGAISTWELLLGSNRFYPCGQVAWNWESSRDMYKWDPLRSDNVQGTAKDSTWFFFNHPAANAQTFLAASYGLMQVGYASALDQMTWFASEPDARHWANLIAPNANIYLGTRWLAWWPRPNVYSLEARATHFKATFDLLMIRALCTYNGRGYDPTTKQPVDHCDYTDAITGNAAGLVPSF